MSISIFQKTLRYDLAPSANPSEVTNNTPFIVGNSNIWIPENSPSTPVYITSAIVYFTAQDASTATGASISNLQISCSVNSAAATAIVDATTITNSAENWSLMFGPYDFTTQFRSNLGTATSASVLVTSRINVSTGTGTTTRAQYSWVDITYEYSASSTLRGQSLCIPIYRNNVGVLPTAQGTFGTIPQISGSGGLLAGYNNMIVRDAHLEFRGNTCVSNVATDMTLRYTFDSDASANLLPVRENALASDTYSHFIIPYPAVSCSAAHTFELWCDVASRYSNPTVNLWVTLEYDPTGMTTIVNNIRIPFEYTSPLTGTAATNSSRYVRKLRIPEPGPITFKYGSFEVFANTNASVTFQSKLLQESSFKTYAFAHTQVAGQTSFSHYISSSFINLNTGSNEIGLDTYRSTGLASNLSGIITLVYESNIYTSGSDYHSKTVMPIRRQFTHALFSATEINSSMSIVEPKYYTQGVSMLYNLPTSLGSSGTSVIRVQELSGSTHVRYLDVYVDQVISDAELGYTTIYIPARDVFKRFPNDYGSDRLEVTESRAYNVSFSTSARWGEAWVYSYHNIVRHLSGTIAGSAGGTVTLSLVRNDSNEVLEQKSVSGNSTFTFDVYDNELHYVIAYEDNTLKGRSKTDRPGGGFDINLSSTGGSSEHSYTWIG